jgi:hypothetical protein
MKEEFSRNLCKRWMNWTVKDGQECANLKKIECMPDREAVYLFTDGLRKYLLSSPYVPRTVAGAANSVYKGKQPS